MATYFLFDGSSHLSNTIVKYRLTRKYINVKMYATNITKYRFIPNNGS